jgi:hypothetical protein
LLYWPFPIGRRHVHPVMARSRETATDSGHPSLVLSPTSPFAALDDRHPDGDASPSTVSPLVLSDGCARALARARSCSSALYVGCSAAMVGVHRGPHPLFLFPGTTGPITESLAQPGLYMVVQDGHCAHRRANQPLAAGLHLKISFLIYLERHPHRRDRRDHGSTRPTWTSLPERLTTKYGSARPRPRRDAGADPRTAGGLVELSRLCSRVQLVTPAGAPRSCGRCYPNGSPPSTDLHGHDLGGTRAAPPERLVA